MVRVRLTRCCSAADTVLERWEQPLSDLAAQADAGTVVIFAEPLFNSTAASKAVDEIFKRGGRVLVTGISGGQLAA